MHEFGIVSSVLETVMDCASRARATKVLAVTLRVGDLVQAQEDSLLFSYEILTEDTIAQGSNLIIEQVKPRSHCIDCDRDFTHNGLDLRCPFCGSISTQLVAGKELSIASIDVDIPDEVDNNQE